MSSDTQRPAAIVTGGGTGIGQAIALALHRDGFGVVVAGRRLEPLEATAALIGDDCVVHQGDIREDDVQDALVEACMERFGRIDVLVNNAGGQFVANAEDITPNGWSAVRRLNLDAPFALIQKVARRWMIPNRTGRVVSIVLCPTRGIAGMAHSSAARAGMGALTNTLALEWGKHNIGLVCVAPGQIDSSGMEQYNYDLAEVAERVPMKRLGTCEEVADLVAFLSSPKAAYISGTTIVIDGAYEVTSA